MSSPKTNITKISTPLKILYFVLIVTAMASVIVFAILFTSCGPDESKLVPILVLVIGCGAPLVLVFVISLALGMVHATDKERNEIKKAEKVKFKKYSRLHGREKRLQILKDELHELEAKRDRPLTLAKDMLKVRPKERNWGVAGGIASAAGGLGAGIAVASEIELENERKRQEYSQDLKTVLSAMPQDYIQNCKKYNSKIEALEEKIKETEKAQIDESFNTDKCFELLNCVCRSEMNVSNKTLSVSTAVRYQDNGNIDGCLLATMIANGKKVGKTLLVLPLEGVSRGIVSHATGKIVLPYKFDERTSYSIKITPYSLCLFE